MNYKKAVKTKHGHIGLIILGQNGKVCIEDTTGHACWAYEDEITQADDILVFKDVKVEKTCSCCDGKGKRKTTERIVVKK